MPTDRFRPFLLIVTLIISVFTGCTERELPPPSSSDEVPSATEINWFQGSVEEAFELAKYERRPIFLYWGAEWCPPCHALRTKLFTRPEFIARLSATIPVYLDGDTERAQIWGDKLDTYGYPTVIILDPDGNEITRIQGTLPVDHYGEIVSDAIQSSKPITEIVSAIEAGGAEAVPPAELSILAFYSFGQDQTLNLGIERERTLFAKLREETPETLEIEKARFLTLELLALADSDQETPPAELSAERRAELISALEELLSDPRLRNTNLDLVLYGTTSVVPLLTPEPGSERDELVASWIDAAKAVQADETLSTNDRLSGLYPRIRLARLDAKPSENGENPKVPEDLQEEIRKGVKWASSVVKGEDEMQALMNTMAGMLETAGLTEEAGTLLSEKMSETTAPYYYMGWLASIEAETGDPDKAVDLYRQAWQSARDATSPSSMSAFRWGSSYLRNAMKYTPDRATAISSDTDTIVGDLLSGPDAFSGGNWTRLQGLHKAIRDWEDAAPESRKPAAEELEAQVEAACENLPQDGSDSSMERCLSFKSEINV